MVMQNGEGNTNGESSKFSMNGYANEPEEKPMNDFEKAMKRLVNIERIDEPAEEEYKLTMKQKEDAKKIKDGKSKGLPPAGSGVVGSNATLADISRVKGVSFLLFYLVRNRNDQFEHSNAHCVLLQI